MTDLNKEALEKARQAVFQADSYVNVAETAIRAYLAAAPAPAGEVEELARKLDDVTTDWDGSRMVDGEPPRDVLNCRDLRETAAMLRTQADRIATLEADRDYAVTASCEMSAELAHEEDRAEAAERERDAADEALRTISMTLGGSDEWSDQRQMILDVHRQVAEVHTRADVAERERDEAVTALRGVVRVADRATAEFDAARAVIAKAEARND
jgi:hypothetical protein